MKTFLLLLLLCESTTAAFADEPRTAGVECLSDLLPDRMISMTQGWGQLGLDTMVRSTVRVSKPILHLGELGLGSKVVPSGQAAPKLRIKDKQYARGLGHHANGEIVINLSGQYKTFEADVGVQWSDGKSPGSVVFQVLVDGKKVFDSGVMRENDPPRPVNVSVAGADELRLVCNDAGDGISADCADWADARLVRDPAADRSRDEPPVDVAPFARVLSWDPKVVQGTKAIRSDEFPAKDIAPYKEVLPSADETYTIPTTNGAGSIGLQWDENRILRCVAVEFPDQAAAAAAGSVQLQYWIGESEWQGKWQPASVAPRKVGNTLTWPLDYQDLKGGTQKVRWVFSDAREPIVLKRISAFTHARWKTVDLCIRQAEPGSAKQAQIEVYNGVILNGSRDDRRAGVSPAAGNAGETPALRRTWDDSKPLLLKVRAAAAQPYKADRTVLRFKTPGAAFGVAIEDLLTHDCVYVPYANVFVTRLPSPVTPKEHLDRIARRQSIVEIVRQKPDQDLRHACEVIHNRTQDVQGWVPTLISLACDNRKFLVYREGSIVFNEYNGPSDFPGESDGIHTVAANVGQWQFVPQFGNGGPLQFTRHLRGGWLPMPVTTATQGNVSYQQTAMVAPVGDAPAGGPAWLRERAMGVIDYVVKNNGTAAADARLSLSFAALDQKKPLQYQTVPEGLIVRGGERLLAFIDIRKTAALTWKIEADGTFVFSGKLAAGAETACTVYVPAWKAGPDDFATLAGGAPWAPRVESYWKSLLAPAMQIEIPDEFLGNLIRASQVNCMLAARNQQRSRYVVPWISAIHFAYPESEANSIMRGMDMTGHPEFARRGLEFYLKEANPAGFITILVHNKVANISSGYTLVGTGEILWTLGEHYQRTRDQAWLRKVAPDVVRICQWLIRQREKTKRLDARGEKVPEYGLMPPGVSADWNRFAYRFFNEAQYYRGLEMAGRALAEVGDPAAAAILQDAKTYREDIARAYHAMQAKTPVVPLRNGTWVPADPSLLGCYGNVEDFLPGEDENRTYVYSVDVGAHHLVVDGVLDPVGKDADWMIDYLEDVQFLRTPWIKDPAKADPFDWGGFAKMQPYYCRIADIHAQRDDVKPFVRSYFNAIPALVNFEEMTFWEDMLGGGCASGAFNKTHETGWFLGQTHTMFVTERGDELWLAPFVTNQWLKDGQEVAARNVPTSFGKVGYTITSHVAKGQIDAVIHLSDKCPAKKVVLRLRHPEGKPIQSVTVQGKPHSDFDPQKETITLAPAGETIAVRAEY
jgi:hypothetical protein